MKRTLLLATLLSILLGPVSICKAQETVFSYTHQGTTLYYIIDSTDNAAVVPPLYNVPNISADSLWYGYAKPQGAVVVPNSVPFDGSDHVVKAIGPSAFRFCDALTSITLPTTLTKIGDHGFHNCTALESIDIQLELRR